VHTAVTRHMGREGEDRDEDSDAPRWADAELIGQGEMQRDRGKGRDDDGPARLWAFDVSESSHGYSIRMSRGRGEHG
jgi:hypothetical protein